MWSNVIYQILVEILHTCMFMWISHIKIYTIRNLSKSYSINNKEFNCLKQSITVISKKIIKFRFFTVMGTFNYHPVTDCGISSNYSCICLFWKPLLVLNRASRLLCQRIWIKNGIILDEKLYKHNVIIYKNTERIVFQIIQIKHLILDIV